MTRTDAARALDAVLIPFSAMAAAAVVFGAIIACLGTNPLDVYALMWTGGFGSAFSWHNTLIRASPLLLTALCAALPAQMGLAVIGGEGALVLGGLAAVESARACAGLPLPIVMAAMVIASCGVGGLVVGAAGALRAYRGVNETIGSLLITYLSIALFNQLVEGPLRDPSDLNKPSTYPLPADAMIGSIPGTEVHWGVPIGIVACVAAFVLINFTVPGFSLRVAGGNSKTARMVGLPVARMMVGVCVLGGAAAGLAGMIETAAINGKANSSLIAGYGFTGILISFLARHNPLAIIPAAFLLGGIAASGGLIQRRLGLPDASVLVLQGTIFFFVLIGETLRGRDLFGLSGAVRPRAEAAGAASAAEASPATLAPPTGAAVTGESEAWLVPLAIVGGAIRGSTPFLFVSLGECLTEKSGRINLGQEGILVLGAMVGYAGSYGSHSPWAGVALAGFAGGLLGLCHAFACQFRRVSDVAVGIALIMLGTGLAFLFGKPFIQPQAPMLPAVDFGWWSEAPRIHAALSINMLFFLGVALAVLLRYGFSSTRWGVIVRMVGDSADAARALGYGVDRVRLYATAVGGVLSGIGGSFLSLYYPGSWTESLSSGQGLMAVALVIFARWDPVRCLWASLLFGGASALGPALQTAGLSQYTYIVGAAPYMLTLAIMGLTCSTRRRAIGAPGELRIA